MKKFKFLYLVLLVWLFNGPVQAMAPTDLNSKLANLKGSLAQLKNKLEILKSTLELLQVKLKPKLIKNSNLEWGKNSCWFDAAIHCLSYADEINDKLKTKFAGPPEKTFELRGRTRVAGKEEYIKNNTVRLYSKLVEKIHGKWDEKNLFKRGDDIESGISLSQFIITINEKLKVGQGGPGTGAEGGRLFYFVIEFSREMYEKLGLDFMVSVFVDSVGRNYDFLHGSNPLWHDCNEKPCRKQPFDILVDVCSDSDGEFYEGVKRVTIPKILYLNCEQETRHGICFDENYRLVLPENMFDESVSEIIKGKEIEYDLFAVGFFSPGHVWAIVSGDGRSDSSVWYKYDHYTFPHEVRTLSKEDMFDIAKKGKDGLGDARCFFYRLSKKSEPIKEALDKDYKEKLAAAK